MPNREVIVLTADGDVQFTHGPSATYEVDMAEWASRPIDLASFLSVAPYSLSTAEGETTFLAPPGIRAEDPFWNELQTMVDAGDHAGVEARLRMLLDGPTLPSSDASLMFGNLMRQVQLLPEHQALRSVFVGLGVSRIATGQSFLLDAEPWSAESAATKSGAIVLTGQAGEALIIARDGTLWRSSPLGWRKDVDYNKATPLLRPTEDDQLMLRQIAEALTHRQKRGWFDRRDRARAELLNRLRNQVPSWRENEIEVEKASTGTHYISTPDVGTVAIDPTGNVFIGTPGQVRFEPSGSDEPLIPDLTSLTPVPEPQPN